MITGSKEQIIEAMQTLEDGKYYSVEVTPVGESCTRGQQNRFHKVCRALADATGYTLGEMKAVLTKECFGETRPTSSLSTKEMYDLIEMTQQLAAEQGIYDVT